jgi:hypothetical protein
MDAGPQPTAGRNAGPTRGHRALAAAAAVEGRLRLLKQAGNAALAEADSQASPYPPDVLRSLAYQIAVHLEALYDRTPAGLHGACKGKGCKGCKGRGVILRGELPEE